LQKKEKKDQKEIEKVKEFIEGEQAK